MRSLVLSLNLLRDSKLPPDPLAYFSKPLGLVLVGFSTRTFSTLESEPSIWLDGLPHCWLDTLAPFPFTPFPGRSGLPRPCSYQGLSLC